MGKLTVHVRRCDPTMIVRNGQIVARLTMPEGSHRNSAQVTVEAPDDVIIERARANPGRRVTTAEVVEAFERALKRV